MRNCTFESNQGTAIALDESYLTDVDSSFLRNSQTASAVIQLTARSSYEGTGITFSNNEGVDGGAIDVEKDSNFTCHTCNFDRNYAQNKGGVLIAMQNGWFNITNGTFTKNEVGNRGSAIYASNNDRESYIRDSVFEFNEAYELGTIFLIASNLNITSSRFSYNLSKTQSPGLIVFLSTLRCHDVDLQHMTGTYGTFISLAISSDLYLYESRFINGTATSSGAALYMVSSELEIDGAVFEDITASEAAGIFSTNQSDLKIKNANFKRCRSLDAGGLMYVFESNLSFEDSWASDFSNGGISADSSSISISNSTLLNGVSTNTQSTFHCKRCSAVSIDTTTFQNNTAEVGGAVSVFTLSEAPINETFYIKQCYFINNSANAAGAIYSDDQVLEIDTSQFKNNTATETNGGALLLKCTNFDYCRFNLIFNTFIGNIAKVDGGAISWTDVMPEITSHIYNNNSALYGNDISSYPIKMERLSDLRRRLTTSDHSIENIASGQVANVTLNIALVDHYGQIVASNSIDECELAPGNSNTTSLGGVTKVTAQSGVFVFDNFEVIAEPGYTVDVDVRSVAINTEKAAKAQDNIPYENELHLDAIIREWEIGEARVGNTCQICQAPQYSLDPTQQTCYDCPNEAECYGNWTLVPKSGYWRSNKYTEIFFSCPKVEACLGSPDYPDPVSYTGECAQGYKGNMCHAWDTGYSKLVDDECAMCPEPTQNHLILTGTLLGIICVMVLMVRGSLTTKTTSLHSVYIRIFVNYLQVIMIMISFNLNWPKMVREMLSYQESAGSATGQIFSVECFMQDTFDIDVFFQKLLFYGFMPFAIFCLSGLFWLLWSLKKRNLDYMRLQFVATLIIVMFLAHPQILRMMLSAFACQEIETDEYWLLDNLDIQCWGTTHAFFALFVALPGLLAWGVMLPAVILMFIIKNKNNLEDLKVKERYGFLLLGYRKQRFYWEFIILYRKVIIVFVSVFMSSISLTIQGLLACLLLFIAFYLQSSFRPFFIEKLNRLEELSILTAATTIYCGLLYLTDDLDESTKMALFLIMVLVNFFFITFWLLSLFEAVAMKIAEKFPRLAKCCCKCYLKSTAFRKLATNLGIRFLGNIIPVSGGKGPLDLSETIAKFTENANSSNVWDNDKGGHAANNSMFSEASIDPMYPIKPRSRQSRRGRRGRSPSIKDCGAQQTFGVDPQPIESITSEPIDSIQLTFDPSVTSSSGSESDSEYEVPISPAPPALSSDSIQQILNDEQKFKAMAKAAFDAVDTDGSGAIDEEELKAAFGSGNDLGFSLPSDMDIKDLMNEIDADGNGEIELEEFEQFMRQVLEMLSQQQLESIPVRRSTIELEEQKVEHNVEATQIRQILNNDQMFKSVAKAAFDAVDTDGSGTIDEEELKAAFLHGNDAVGFPLPDDVDISEVFNQLDADGSGEIDLEEFEGFIRHVLELMANQ